MDKVKMSVWRIRISPLRPEFDSRARQWLYMRWYVGRLLARTRGFSPGTPASFQFYTLSGL